jgi:hypothetical protein
LAATFPKTIGIIRGVLYVKGGRTVQAQLSVLPIHSARALSAELIVKITKVNFLIRSAPNKNGHLSVTILNQTSLLLL